MYKLYCLRLDFLEAGSVLGSPPHYVCTQYAQFINRYNNLNYWFQFFVFKSIPCTCGLARKSATPLCSTANASLHHIIKSGYMDALSQWCHGGATTRSCSQDINTGHALLMDRYIQFVKEVKKSQQMQFLPLFSCRKAGWKPFIFPAGVGSWGFAGFAHQLFALWGSWG